MMRKITAGGGRGLQKYTQKTNRNIKLLSLAKSIVLHIHREREREGEKVRERDWGGEWGRGGWD